MTYRISEEPMHVFPRLLCPNCLRIGGLRIGVATYNSLGIHAGFHYLVCECGILINLGSARVQIGPHEFKAIATPQLRISSVVDNREES
jgi:hypothetical protein